MQSAGAERGRPTHKKIAEEKRNETLPRIHQHLAQTRKDLRTLNRYLRYLQKDPSLLDNSRLHQPARNTQLKR